MDRHQARNNIKTLLQGKTPRKALSLGEAKARLRAADPGINISRSLHDLNRGKVKAAGTALVIETAAVVTIPYLQPLLTRVVLGLFTGRKLNR